MRVMLPDATGRMMGYEITGKPLPEVPLGPNPARVVYAAAHVVADPFSDRDPSGQAAIDWRQTMAFRHYLAGLGLGIAEAMDTAQRGMGLDWPTSLELIRRSLDAARDVPGALVVSGSAFAQDRALAEDLFNQAKALYDAGKYSEACPKFADSQRSDPQIGTMLNLALCHDKEGKTASAYAEYKEAAALAQQKSQQDRVDFARKGAADLEPKLSRITLKVEKPTHGQTVKLDELVVPESAWGSPFARDPGKHQLEVAAPGKTTWTQELVVAAGPAQADVVVPALTDAPAAPTSSPTFSANTDKGGSNTKTLGYVIGGVGVAGLAVGGIFGLMYLSKRDESNGVCTQTNPNNAAGKPCNDGDVAAAENLKSSAETLGLVSTIGFIAGAVGVGAGAYFILTSKSPDRTTASTTLRFAPTGGPTVGGGTSAGMRLEGSF